MILQSASTLGRPTGLSEKVYLIIINANQL